eukprot:5023390-Amphidinium_carterae.1
MLHGAVATVPFYDTRDVLPFLLLQHRRKGFELGCLNGSFHSMLKLMRSWFGKILWTVRTSVQCASEARAEGVLCWVALHTRNRCSSPFQACALIQPPICCESQNVDTKSQILTTPKQSDYHYVNVEEPFGAIAP